MNINVYIRYISFFIIIILLLYAWLYLIMKPFAIRTVVINVLLYQLVISNFSARWAEPLYCWTGTLNMHTLKYHRSLPIFNHHIIDRLLNCLTQWNFLKYGFITISLLGHWVTFWTIGPSLRLHCRSYRHHIKQGWV